MGEIINSKSAYGNKMIYKILLNETEAINLKGHMRNVHIFAKERCYYETNILERGNKKGAKYFIIPRKLKSRQRPRFAKIKYQKIDNGNEVFYICTVNKDSLH